MTEKEILKKRILLTKERLKKALSLDWIGEVITSTRLLEKYEKKLKTFKSKIKIP